MTKPRTIPIQCPSCQWETEGTVYDAVNSALDPKRKEELFQGKINVFHCEQCGFQGIIPHPFLYLDPERQFCVQYYPPSYLDDAVFLGGFLKDGSIRFNLTNEEEIPAYIRQWHIVFDLDEMVRYIIFRERIYKP